MFSPGFRLRLSKFEFLRPLKNSHEILLGTAGRANLRKDVSDLSKRVLAAIPSRPEKRSGSLCDPSERTLIEGKEAAADRNAELY